MLIKDNQAPMPASIESGVAVKDNVLSEEQRGRFHEEGYLVLPNWWSKQECQEIRKQVQEIIENLDLDEARTVFATDQAERFLKCRRGDHGFNLCFLRTEIRFFWEPEAFDEKGEFVQDRFQCINKIGHALHDLDPVLKKYSYESRVGQEHNELVIICPSDPMRLLVLRQKGSIGEVARELGLEVPLAVQSMYIFKQPRIGGEVSPHQDGTFLYTEPQSVLGFWWALEDCTLENGCLHAVPRSQGYGVHRRFKQSLTKEGCEFEPPEQEKYEIEAAVPLEVKAGTLVLLHHSLVHFSGPNKSDKSRHAYSIHVVEGAEGFEYPKDNWLQRPVETPFQQLP